MYLCSEYNLSLLDCWYQADFGLQMMPEYPKEPTNTIKSLNRNIPIGSLARKGRFYQMGLPKSNIEEMPFGSSTRRISWIYLPVLASVQACPPADSSKKYTDNALTPGYSLPGYPLARYPLAWLPMEGIGH